MIGHGLDRAFENTGWEVWYTGGGIYAVVGNFQDKNGKDTFLYMAHEGFSFIVRKEPKSNTFVSFEEAQEDSDLYIWQSYPEELQVPVHYRNYNTKEICLDETCKDLLEQVIGEEKLHELEKIFSKMMKIVNREDEEEEE